MSELDLPALAVVGNTQDALTPIKEIDAALKECKFGFFHIKLLCIAFVGIVAAVLVGSSTSYVLPVAECDLEMTLLGKGLLAAAPYTGMLFSSVIGGFLTDAFGRKIFLVLGNLGIFIFTLISASSGTFEILVSAKFFEGVLFGISFSALVTLTAEFCHNGIRDRIVLCQSSFSAISQILIPLMSWGILTQDWKSTFFGGRYVLNTWNFYLYAMSLWSLTATIMYGLFVPESPKYLVTQKRYDEARDILIKMYVQNTGKPAETYPYANIWKDRPKDKSVVAEGPDNVKNSFMRHIIVGLHNVKPMFKKPLVKYLGLICLMNTAVMAEFNVFRLWFPQLSAIVENYQGEGQDLCVMLDAYTNNLKASAILNSSHVDVCIPTKSGDATYINSIIIGCICLLPFFITGVLVNKVGKKLLLVIAGVMCIAGAVSLRWANSTAAIVSLFSLTIAVSQIMLTLNQAITVEVFGTTMRSLAISLMMFTGRLGSLMGNICFPILLNMGCVIPFFAIGGLMVLVTILAILIPTKK